MKKVLLLIAATPLMFCSCVTPPAQVFHNTDHSALIVESIDARSSQLVGPTATSRNENSKALDLAKSFPQRQTAVVILENYSESELGKEFHDRTTLWFISLRGLGYQHIVFLKGNGIPNPNGLITLADYD
jgi:hypothetical protein